MKIFQFIRLSLFFIFACLSSLDSAFSQGVPRVASLHAVRDGYIAYCDSMVQGMNEMGVKHMTLELLGSISEDFTHRAKLRVTLVRCENGVYIKDHDPTLEHYTSLKGLPVMVVYSKFRIKVIDQHDHLLMIKNLPDLELQAQAEFETPLADDHSPMHVTQFSLCAEKAVFYKNEVISNETIIFGTYNLVLRHNLYLQ